MGHDPQNKQINPLFKQDLAHYAKCGRVITVFDLLPSRIYQPTKTYALALGSVAVTSLVCGIIKDYKLK